MNRVWLWIERPKKDELGQIVGMDVERHVGPFERYVRTQDGRNIILGTDEVYVSEVMRLLGGYDGQNAWDVAKDITPDAIVNDKTGALRHVAEALMEVAKRAIEREQRAELGKLRAVWLADYDLAQMVVRVRGE